MMNLRIGTCVPGVATVSGALILVSRIVVTRKHFIFTVKRSLDILVAVIHVLTILSINLEIEVDRHPGSCSDSRLPDAVTQSNGGA